MNLFVTLLRKPRRVTWTGTIGQGSSSATVRTLEIHLIVIFSTLLLLILQCFRRNEMSVSPLVNEFKEKCTTENKIVNGLRKHNDFLVYAYSLNKHRR